MCIVELVVILRRFRVCRLCFVFLAD